MKSVPNPTLKILKSERTNKMNGSKCEKSAEIE